MWRHCNHALFLLFWIAPLHGINLGSADAVSSEQFTTFPSVDTDNAINGFALMDAGFALEDSVTTCTFGSFFPVRGAIQLNSGTLWLTRDLVLQNVTTFTNLGDIKSDSLQALSLASMMSVLGYATSRVHTFSNINLVLTSNMTLDSYIQFSGNCSIEGAGNELDLGSTGSLIVAADSSLALKDIILLNIHTGNLVCTDDSSELVLNKMRWEQDAEFAFDTGSILFKNKVDFVGSQTFIYSSSYTSTIDAFGIWNITDGCYLFIGRDVATANEPLAFQDDTARFRLDSCSLNITSSGMQLTKGIIEFANQVNLDMSATGTHNGLVFGNANSDDDIKVILTPSSHIAFLSGFLAYNNGNRNNLVSKSTTAQLVLHPDARLHALQDVDIPRMTLEERLTATEMIHVGVGKEFRFNDTLRILPGAIYTDRCTYGNDNICTTSGGDLLFFTKGTLEREVHVSHGNASVLGNGNFSAAITLEDSDASFTFGISGFINNFLYLNEGTAIIQNDLMMLENARVTGPGTVDLTTRSISVNGSDLILDSSIHWVGNGGFIRLNTPLSLSSTWTIDGKVTLDGYKNELTLNDGAALVVNPDSELVLKNIRVLGVQNNNIRCLDDTGVISFTETNAVLDGDYTFTTGSMKFNFDTSFTGTHIFTYDSAYTATIQNNSKVKFKNGATFSIDRSDVDSSVEPLEFAGRSSVLQLDDSTLSIGDQGMQVTKGTVRISRGSTLEINSTSTVNGFMLGNGQSAGDAFIQLDPAAILDLNSGHLIYNITDSSGFISKSRTSRIIQGDAFSTHFMKNIVFSDATIQLGLASFTTDPGVSVDVSNVSLDTPVGDYRITGSRPSASTVALSGSGDSFYIDSGVAPFPIMVSGTNNTIGGEGDITAPIVLQDSDTELTSQLIGRLTSSMVMNGGTLILANDLHLANGVMFVGDDSVNLNSAGLYLGSQNLSWSGNTYWSGTGGALHLSSDISLVGTWTFSGDCTIHGNGHLIDLENGTIFVDSNSSTLLHGVKLTNINDKNIQCVDDTADVLLDDVRWYQQDGVSFVFDTGALRFKHKVKMLGNSMFVYSTSQTSTICAESSLIMDTDFTFSYDPGIASKNLLLFEDDTAQLTLKGATLHSTATGMQLTKGHLKIKGDAQLSSDTELVQTPIPHILNEGITFGSGVAVDDFTCTIEGGASLTLTEGTLVYNNTDPDLLIIESDASVFKIGAQARLTLEESLRLVTGGIEFGNHATLMIKNGRTLTGSIFPLGYLHRRSKA